MFWPHILFGVRKSYPKLILCHSMYFLTSRYSGWGTEMLSRPPDILLRHVSCFRYFVLGFRKGRPDLPISFSRCKFVFRFGNVVFKSFWIFFGGFIFLFVFHSFAFLLHCLLVSSSLLWACIVFFFFFFLLYLLSLSFLFSNFLFLTSASSSSSSISLLSFVWLSLYFLFLPLLLLCFLISS